MGRGGDGKAACVGDVEGHRPIGLRIVVPHTRDGDGALVLTHRDIIAVGEGVVHIFHQQLAGLRIIHGDLGGDLLAGVALVSHRAHRDGGHGVRHGLGVDGKLLGRGSVVVALTYDGHGCRSGVYMIGPAQGIVGVLHQLRVVPVGVGHRGLLFLLPAVIGGSGDVSHRDGSAGDILCRHFQRVAVLGLGVVKLILGGGGDGGGTHLEDGHRTGGRIHLSHIRNGARVLQRGQRIRAQVAGQGGGYIIISIVGCAVYHPLCFHTEINGLGGLGDGPAGLRVRPAVVLLGVAANTLDGNGMGAHILFAVLRTVQLGFTFVKLVVRTFGELCHTVGIHGEGVCDIPARIDRHLGRGGDGKAAFVGDIELDGMGIGVVVQTFDGDDTGLGTHAGVVMGPITVGHFVVSVLDQRHTRAGLGLCDRDSRLDLSGGVALGVHRTVAHRIAGLDGFAVDGELDQLGAGIVIDTLNGDGTCSGIGIPAVDQRKVLTLFQHFVAVLDIGDLRRVLCAVVGHIGYCVVGHILDILAAGTDVVGRRGGLVVSGAAGDDRNDRVAGTVDGDDMLTCLTALLGFDGGDSFLAALIGIGVFHLLHLAAVQEHAVGCHGDLNGLTVDTGDRLRGHIERLLRLGDIPDEGILLPVVDRALALDGDLIALFIGVLLAQGGKGGGFVSVEEVIIRTLNGGTAIDIVSGLLHLTVVDEGGGTLGNGEEFAGGLDGECACQRALIVSHTGDGKGTGTHAVVVSPSDIKISAEAKLYIATFHILDHGNGLTGHAADQLLRGDLVHRKLGSLVHQSLGSDVEIAEGRASEASISLGRDLHIAARLAAIAIGVYIGAIALLEIRPLHQGDIPHLYRKAGGDLGAGVGPCRLPIGVGHGDHLVGKVLLGDVHPHGARSLRIVGGLLYGDRHVGNAVFQRRDGTGRRVQIDDARIRRAVGHLRVVKVSRTESGELDKPGNGLILVAVGHIQCIGGHLGLCLVDLEDTLARHGAAERGKLDGILPGKLALDPELLVLILGGQLRAARLYCDVCGRDDGALQ